VSSILSHPPRFWDETQHDSLLCVSADDLYPFSISRSFALCTTRTSEFNTLARMSNAAEKECFIPLVYEMDLPTQEI
jgi:hypothetical protein